MKSLTILIFTGALALTFACTKKKEENAQTTPDAAQPEPTEGMAAGTPPAMVPAAKTPSSQPAAKKGAAPKKAKPQTKELWVDGSKFTLDKKTGVYTFCENCRRRSARYYYYLFNKAEYEKAVGAANVKKRLKLQIQIVATKKKNHKPADPNAPQPSGGFTHIKYECKVLKVVK